MSEMVERVMLSLRDSHLPKGQVWGNASHLDPYFVQLARIAIAAMREPTEAMLKAEGPLGRRVDNSLDDWDAVDVWQAMIDEALK